MLLEGYIKPNERLVCNILVCVNMSSPSQDWNASKSGSPVQQRKEVKNNSQKTHASIRGTVADETKLKMK